jgi:hypothetical protein
MQQMLALRKQWDPDGGRVMGARGNDAVAPIPRLLRSPNSYGIMIGQDRGPMLSMAPRHVPRIQRGAPRPRAVD